MPFQVTADPEAFQYATRSDAAAYAARRGGGVAFLALSSDAQDQQLVAASIDLDTSDWIGTRATLEQEREWARTGTDYSEDAWPGLIQTATIELAFWNAQRLADDAAADVLNPALTSNIKREKTGPLETEYFAPPTTEATDPARWPTIVQALIAPLIRQPDVAAWGSGVSYRGS